MSPKELPTLTVTPDPERAGVWNVTGGGYNKGKATSLLVAGPNDLNQDYDNLTVSKDGSIAFDWFGDPNGTSGEYAFSVTQGDNVVSETNYTV